MSDMPGGPTPPPPPPPAGTPPGPGGLRPRTLGEILSAAFQIYKDNLAKLALIVAVVVVPLSLIGAAVTEAVASSDETTMEVFGQTQTVSDRTFAAVVAGSLVAALIAVIISAVLQAAMMRAASLATIGDPVDVEASYRWGFKRFGSVLLVGLLVGIVIVVGFLLLIIPGIIFLTLLSVSIPALVIENRRGTDAMKRSWELASGNFWHVLGVIVVAFLITSLVSSVIGSIGGDNWFVAWIFSAIAQIVTAPFAALVTVLLYLDLRARREALTADSLRAELASNV
jgi:Uncharacterised protein family (UPF0259)